MVIKVHLTLTENALEYIQKRNSSEIINKKIVAIFRTIIHSWAGTCYNDRIRLISKERVLHRGSFERWNEIGESNIEIYILKHLLNEWKDSKLVIDLKIPRFFGRRRAKLIYYFE